MKNFDENIVKLINEINNDLNEKNSYLSKSLFKYLDLPCRWAAKPPLILRLYWSPKPILSKNELVRLAIPRRTYTQSHIDYVIEVIKNVYDNRSSLKGLVILKEPRFLRHFTAKLKLRDNKWLKLKK